MNNDSPQNMIDFAAFMDANECNKHNRDINKCQSLNRIIWALKYYTSLNTKTNKEGQTMFVNFIQTLYANYLNDSVHLTTAHEQHLHDINQSLFTKYKFKQCNVSSCNLTQRHCRINVKNKTEDAKFSFYENVFDSIHFYLMHLYEVGLRSVKNDDMDQMEQDEKAKSDDITRCVDKEFSTRKQNIDNKRKQLSAFFNRFESNPNKFNIEANYDEKKVSADIDERTFLDGLYCSISNKKMSALKSYLENEEFDSDALKIDIDEYVNNKISNISNQFNDDKQLSQQIYKYIETQQLKSMAFSTGFVFWYWPYYAPNNDADDKNAKPTTFNDNDFGGYSTADLYIKKGKWDTFKQEILEYSDITMLIYEQILVKVEEYFSTNRVKSIAAKKQPPYAPRFYGIDEGSKIQKSHIITFVLYCDFSNLSTRFSESLRRLHPLENLDAVKERNKKFWWMSKLLREAVEIYGDDGVRRGDDGKWRWQNADDYDECIADEPGPFFCGMSCVMVMPSFSIRLSGPTSTTKQFQVSLNFAKHEGIIIKLDNQYGGGGAWQRFFNVSWLSTYKEEDERVTIGGSFPLQIISITNTSTHENYEIYFAPLFYFDSALSGVGLLGMDGLLSDGGIEIITCLIQYSYGIKTETIDFDEYILDTFKMWCLTKQAISINMETIDNRCPKEIKNMLFDSFCEDKDNANDQDNNKSNRNLLNLNILNMFPNLQNINIYSTNTAGKKSYSFSLLRMTELLSKIQAVKNGNDVKCVIDGVFKEFWSESGQRSWIYHQYSQPSIKFNSFLSLTTYNDKKRFESLGFLNVDWYHDILTIGITQ